MSLPTVAVLAGGLGTRIQSVAGDTPKVLLPVSGKPFLSHLMILMAGQGVAEICLLLGHQADLVWSTARQEVPDGVRLKSCVEPSPLGTGGAVVNALDRLSDPFILWNGDTWLDLSLEECRRSHEAHGGWATIALTPSHNAAEKGIVDFDAQNKITNFEEKSGKNSGWMNAGVYVLNKALFDGMEAGQSVSLERDILPEVVRAGRVYGAVQTGDFVDIGLPEDYASVQSGLPGETP